MLSGCSEGHFSRRRFEGRWTGSEMRFRSVLAQNAFWLQPGPLFGLRCRSRRVSFLKVEKLVALACILAPVRAGREGPRAEAEAAGLHLRVLRRLRGSEAGLDPRLQGRICGSSAGSEAPGRVLRQPRPGSEVPDLDLTLHGWICGSRARFEVPVLDPGFLGVALRPQGRIGGLRASW